MPVYTCGACGTLDTYRKLPAWVEHARAVQSALRLPPDSALARLVRGVARCGAVQASTST
jgi:hypothetical protein